MTGTAKHVAPMDFVARMAEAIARSISPAPGAKSEYVIRHLDETVPLHGRHTAEPTPTGRVLNLSAFRSLHSEIEVTR